MNTISINTEVTISSNKKCNSCLSDKPLEEFNRSSRYKDGRLAFCKKCRKEYDENRIKKTEEITGTVTNKKCGECHILKPVNEFSKNRGTRDGYNRLCKSCWRKIYGTLDSLTKRYDRWKAVAKHRGIEFSLSLEDVKKLPLKCYYTGIDLTVEPNCINTVSLDRVDSNSSYINGNVVLCCYIVNTMKTDLSHEDFVDMCRRVVTKHDLTHPIKLMEHPMDFTI